ncbi:MAG: hypothetical protein V5A27_08520 [Halapricum sp.]
MPTCPYCGESQNALKNHVRLSSGNGHGASGEYPADFDAGGTNGSAVATIEDRDGGGDEFPSEADGSTETGRETVDMTREEFDRAMDEAIEAAREAGYEEGYAEGYDQGYADGQANAEPESPGGTTTGPTETLPCCGNQVPKDDLPDKRTRIRCGECGEELAIAP